MPDQSSWFIKFLIESGEHLKEYIIVLYVGAMYLLYRILRWLGLGFINDVIDLKERSKKFVTHDELGECHRSVTNKMEEISKDIKQHITHIDEKNEQRIKDVHIRIDSDMRSK